MPHTVRATPLATLIAIVLAVVAAAAPARLAAQWTRPDSGAAVYLVTAGPGGDFFTWFGHAALVVADGRRGRDYWYDYGIIDGEWGTTAAHLTGRIRARVVRFTNPRRRLRLLEADDRTVLVQQLRLSPAQTDALVRQLEADVQAFAAGYDYRHVEDNCTTRIRDVIDRASGGALRRGASTDLADRTVREHGYRRFLVRSVPFTMFADIVTGRAIDRPMSEWDAMFLPEELAKQVRRATLADGAPLAADVYRFDSRHHVLPAHPPRHHLPLASLGIALGALALVLGRRARGGSARARVALGVHASVVALVLGAAGLVLAFMWGMTAYTFSHANENVLLANPLVLATLPLAVAYAAGSRRAARVLPVAWTALAALALLTLVLKLLPGFSQDNWRFIALAVPTSVGLAAALRMARGRL